MPHLDWQWEVGRVFQELQNYFWKVWSDYTYTEMLQQSDWFSANIIYMYYCSVVPPALSEQ